MVLALGQRNIQLGLGFFLSWNHWILHIHLAVSVYKVFCLPFLTKNEFVKPKISSIVYISISEFVDKFAIYNINKKSIAQLLKFNQHFVRMDQIS